MYELARHSAIAAYRAATEEDATFADDAASGALVQDLISGIAAAFEEPHRKYKQFDDTYRRVATKNSNMQGGPLEENAVAAMLGIADSMADAGSESTDTLDADIDDAPDDIDDYLRRKWKTPKKYECTSCKAVIGG